MNLHEYQAKQILQRFGIAVPPFGVAATVAEAKVIVDGLGLRKAVVKIQVHAGGRGKAGGVKFAHSPEEILGVVNQLLGMRMVNQQTGSAGVVAHQVLITAPVDILREYYVACAIDRENATPILILSPAGGADIEEIAARAPEKILTMPFPLNGKLRRYQLLRAAKFMGWSWSKAVMEQGMSLLTALAEAFIEHDASLLEINPLVETSTGQLWAIDAKMSIDDNALFRQPVCAKLYDATQLPLNEVLAKEHELAYVALDGEIGCMVNGAGLAMATMDLIQHYGKRPANFLDVGGSASAEKIAEGFKIILSDPNVKAILVNIFGGIMNCGTLAEGIIAAAKEEHVKVPLVVRMEGTNVEMGKKLLRESGLKIISAETLSEAAESVIQTIG
jgi:succinyl-CoA synthetase beta subunit